MRIVQWGENLRLGVPTIDTQHIGIFEVCTRLNEGFGDNQAAAAEAITFLASYLAERHLAKSRPAPAPDRDPTSRSAPRDRGQLTDRLDSD